MPFKVLGGSGGTGSPGPPGAKGDKGDPGEPGKNATINGMNVLNIVDGTNTTVEIVGDTLKINAPAGSGDGGTSDYNALSNKPKIGGIELSGNKDLSVFGIAKNEDLIAETNARIDSDNELSLRVDEAKSIAGGRNQARVFETQQSMLDWLADPENTSELNIGDNLYIIDINVPDYWWDGTQHRQLEAEKVDLTEIYTKNQIDMLLETKATLADLESKANASDVLTKTNSTAYIPTENYHPATKKYVDDNAAKILTSPITKTVSMANLQAEIDALPKILMADVTLNVSSGTTGGTITIEKFTGSGILSIVGAISATTTHSIGRLRILNNTVRAVYVQGINITATSASCVYIEGNSCADLSLDYLNMTAGSNTTADFYGFNAYVNSSVISLWNTQISNKRYGVYIERSDTNVYSLSGSVNQYGITVKSCTLYKRDASPLGATYPSTINSGQIINP